MLKRSVNNSAVRSIEEINCIYLFVRIKLCLALRHQSDAARNQFFDLRPGTRLNSSRLSVTSVRFRANACEAINKSFGPIGWPAFSRTQRMFP